MDKEQPRLHVVGTALSVDVDCDVHGDLQGGGKVSTVSEDNRIRARGKGARGKGARGKGARGKGAAGLCGVAEPPSTLAAVPKVLARRYRGTIRSRRFAQYAFHF